MNRVCYISSDYTADTTLRPIITIAYKANTAGQAPGIVSGRIYCLRNANSGKYLTVPSSTNGTDLTQSSFSGSDNQKFYVAYDSSRQDYAVLFLLSAAFGDRDRGQFRQQRCACPDLDVSVLRRDGFPML